MSVKNILVNLNDVDNVDSMLKTACALALRHDAHLIGVYVVPSFQLRMGLYGSETAMLDLQYSELKKYKEIGNEMVKVFEKALKSHEVLGKSLILNSLDANIAEEFIAQARTVDMIVISNVDPKENCSVEDGFAEKVVLESGRPVLILPRGKVFDKIGDRVNVAWTLTNEATRASFDVLPMLNEDSFITFVCVDTHLNQETAGSLPGAEIAESFSHHALNVNTDSIVSGDGNIGKALLNNASVFNADMLVMGAYSHSRLRQMVFGGATKYIFEHLDLPVLMSR